MYTKYPLPRNANNTNSAHAQHLAEGTTLHLRRRRAARRRLGLLLILRQTLPCSWVDYTNHAQLAVRLAVERYRVRVRDRDGPGLLSSCQ